MSSTGAFLEAEPYHAFRCVGDRCPDTCCQGMAVAVDERTFDRYQKSPHPLLGPRLRNLVNIQPAPTTKNFALIKLEQAQCPFLEKQLCGIQSELGEEYLSDVCRTYPRLLHESEIFGDQRTLDLGCPEAARLLLTNRAGLRFNWDDIGLSDRAPHRIRHLVLSVLQNKRYTVAARLLLVGHICSKLSQAYSSGEQIDLHQIVDGFVFGIEAGFFDGHLSSYTATGVPQLAITLELVAKRVALDYVSPAFVALYGELTEALQFSGDSTLETLGERYEDLYESSYLPFLQRYEYVVENYLAATAFNQVSPFGREAVRQGIVSGAEMGRNIEDQFLMQSVLFSVTKILLVGRAALRGEQMDENAAIEVIQIVARALEHCTLYPAAALELLHEKGIRNVAGVALISQDLTMPHRTAARG